MPMFILTAVRRLLRSDSRQARRDFVSQRQALHAKVRRAVREVVRTENQDRAALQRPRIVGYKISGALHNPRDVRLLLLFRDNVALKQAQESGYTLRLREALAQTLRRDCYPQEALCAIKIEFLGKRELQAAGGAWD